MKIIRMYFLKNNPGETEKNGECIKPECAVGYPFLHNIELKNFDEQTVRAYCCRMKVFEKF